VLLVAAIFSQVPLLWRDKTGSASGTSGHSGGEQHIA